MENFVHSGLHGGAVVNAVMPQSKKVSTRGFP